MILNAGKIDLPCEGIYLVKAPNGTGKTSLFNEISKNYKNEISYSKQENDGVFKDLNILENIAMSTEVHEINRIKKELKELGLIHLINLNPKYLSGGEKRIIAILRNILSHKK